jgi:hypothetical protein
VLITNEFHEFCWFTISGTSDDEKASYGPKFIHIFIMSKTKGSHRQYDMRGWCGTKPGPIRATVGTTDPTSLAGRPGFGIFLKSIFNTCQLKLVRRVSNVGKWYYNKAWPPCQIKWPTNQTSGPPDTKLWPRHRLNPSINTLILFLVESGKKMRFSPL